MDTTIPRFLIIGNDKYISQVLNKLPNKTKLYNIYLYKLLEPLVEYGFSVYNDDNNIYQFKIIVCPDNINTDNILNNVYFSKIDGLIICNNNNYDEFINKLNASENIYIWFDKDSIDNYSKDLHYLFNDNNWINRIYYHMEMPFSAPINSPCNFL